MKKQKQREPLRNNWLFSCSIKYPSEKIKNVLGIVKQPTIELSAKHWQNAHRMANDILNAYGYSATYLYRETDKVNWDGLNDWMFIKGWEGENFLGEVFILRECSLDTSANLAFFVDIVSYRIQEMQKKPHLFAEMRLVVVLAGWTEPDLIGTVSHRRVSWVVNPLPE